MTRSSSINQISPPHSVVDTTLSGGLNTAFYQKLEQLRQMYRSELRSKLDGIDADWYAIQQDWNLGAVERFYLLIHNLAGSGATFGFTTLSDKARELAVLIKPVVGVAGPCSAELKTQIASLLIQLRAAAGLHDERARRGSLIPAQSTPLSDEQIHRVIFIVDADRSFSQYLANQLQLFNYTLVTINQLDALPEALDAQTPAAIIMGLAFPEGELAGAETIERLQQEREEPLPVIFVSVRNDMVSRLQAVRAKGVAYLPKSVDISVFVDTLERVTNRAVPSPYRVLIIEDAHFIAQTYAAVLEQASLVVTIVIDPLQVLQVITDFQPDVIIMDVYMPDCSGRELTAVIRQQPAFVGIPIVFLSAEMDRTVQFTLLQEGGDDFLTKPIRPDHLVSAVTHRAARARLMRERMIRDGLTGLLNHSATKEMLQTTIANAHRAASSFAVAFIDIDHFKMVNDTHGHPVGDTILRNLSHLLQQRLRKSDVIGRYGGEEFLIIFPDTDGAAATSIINELRIRFGQVRHRAGDTWYSVTFSGGVASFPAYTDAHTLLATADSALYEAKRAGRNRIVLADTHHRLVLQRPKTSDYIVN